VAAETALSCEVRQYDRLFTDPDPDGHKDKEFLDFLNPESLKVLDNCMIEPFVKGAQSLENFQFERLGYFNVDPDSTNEKLVFNRTVSLKDNSKK